MAASDLLTFDALSWQLTETESALERLHNESDRHESEAGHNAVADPSRAKPVPSGHPAPVLPQGVVAAMASAAAPVSNSQPSPIGPDVVFCEEKHRLLDELLVTIRELSQLQASQLRSVIEGSDAFIRLEDDLHQAQQRKEDAKYALLAHIATHHCENA